MGHERNQADVNTDSTENVCRGRRGPDCAGTLGHVKIWVFIERAIGSQLRVQAGVRPELSLKCATLATVSKLQGGCRENMVGAINRAEETKGMMIVGLV